MQAFHINIYTVVYIFICIYTVYINSDKEDMKTKHVSFHTARKTPSGQLKLLTMNQSSHAICSNFFARCEHMHIHTYSTVYVCVYI